MDSNGSVWITGAGGLIGNELVRQASGARGLTRGDTDLLDFKQVASLFRKEQPALLIHCAAISRSVDSQGTPDLAWRVNVDATRHLVELAADIPFLFFSTD